MKVQCEGGVYKPTNLRKNPDCHTLILNLQVPRTVKRINFFCLSHEVHAILFRQPYQTNTETHSTDNGNSHIWGACMCAKSHQLCLTLWPCGLKLTRLFGPWDSGKNTAVGCPVLQGIFSTQGLNHVSCTASGFFHWNTGETHIVRYSYLRILELWKNTMLFNLWSFKIVPRFFFTASLSDMRLFPLLSTWEICTWTA